MLVAVQRRDIPDPLGLGPTIRRLGSDNRLEEVAWLQLPTRRKPRQYRTSNTRRMSYLEAISDWRPSNSVAQISRPETASQSCETWAYPTAAALPVGASTSAEQPHPGA